MLVVTFVLTVVFDLVVAIEVGMLIAVVLFMKRMADVAKVRTWTSHGEDISADSERMKAVPENTEVVEFEGPMFFASSEKFSSVPVKDNVKTVIL